MMIGKSVKMDFFLAVSAKWKIMETYLTKIIHRTVRTTPVFSLAGKACVGPSQMILFGKIDLENRELNFYVSENT